MKYTKIRDINDDSLDQIIKVGGWIKNERHSGPLHFIALNDGSTMQTLQLVGEDTKLDFSQISTGAALIAIGKCIASPAQGQKYELQISELAVCGPIANASEYPLPKKKKGLSLEYLRGFQHLRARTNTFMAIMCIRNIVAKETHNFFQSQGFKWIHTPIITGSDCEGAGETFLVKTSDQKPFFSKDAFLTVSGQLHLESYACGLGNGYTFGPTFRAEDSHTTRHLAEFWMIEPELVFIEFPELMDCAEAYLKHMIQSVLDQGREELAFLDKFYHHGLIERLNSYLRVERISYTKAVEILEKDISSGKVEFENPVYWGVDLASEHEKYLTDQVFQCPIIVYDYPRKIKSFYMKDNQDKMTVSAMDLLVPGIGELIGGSMREDDYQTLKDKIKEFVGKIDGYEWYLDLRKYGSVPHGGFGLGFERLVRLVTGMENIKDVIPFPRAPGQLKY